MRLFLDTSSLFKLYHREKGTEFIDDVFATKSVTGIYLSEITKVEFNSTVWKKVRKQEIGSGDADILIKRFESDCLKYSFVEIDREIIFAANRLISKYGKEGLRTLDSVQLSTAVSLADKADLFLSSDKLLNYFFEQESLRITI